MRELTVNELYDLNETIAKDIFDDVTYPWEVLPENRRFYCGAWKDTFQRGV